MKCAKCGTELIAGLTVSGLRCPTCEAKQQAAGARSFSNPVRLKEKVPGFTKEECLEFLEKYKAWETAPLVSIAFSITIDELRR